MATADAVSEQATATALIAQQTAKAAETVAIMKKTLDNVRIAMLGLTEAAALMGQSSTHLSARSNGFNIELVQFLEQLRAA